MALHLSSQNQESSNVTPENHEWWCSYDTACYHASGNMTTNDMTINIPSLPSDLPSYHTNGADDDETMNAMFTSATVSN